MAKHMKVVLTDNQRTRLEKFTNNGVRSTHIVKRATVILELDTANGRKASSRIAISNKVNLSVTAISDIKKDWFAIGDLDTFLQRKKRETPPVETKITGDVQAHIIALACTPPPEGCQRWTLQLLANKSVELKFVDSISDVSVGTVLKKINFSLTGTNIGVFRLNKVQNL